MRKRFSTSLSASLLAAGLVGAAPATAFAAPESDGSGGIASGNQINVPADVKADLCGNALSVLGISQADCTRVSEVLYAASDEGQDSPQTDGSGGVASGNQINIPVDAALDVCGNSAAVGGVAESDCTKVVKKLVAESEDGGSPQTDGSGGIASGNQINLPVDIALDVCGNSVAVLGASKSECKTVVNVIQESAGDGGGSPQTDGSGGVASGNQVNVPVDAAVDICGNAVSVLGVAEAQCLQKISDDDDGGDDEPDDPGKETEPPEDGDETDEPKDPGEDGPGDGDKTPTPEPSSEPGGDSTPDTKPAPEDGDTEASGGLPVTGPALGGLVAAAVAAVGGGGAAMFVSRRRKAAAVGIEDTTGAQE